MSRLASIGASTMLWPPMVTSPSLGGMKPVIIRMVVLLPAPFGPRKPSTSPFSTVKETPLTATFGPNVFFKFRTLIMIGDGNPQRYFWCGERRDKQEPRNV